MTVIALRTPRLLESSSLHVTPNRTLRSASFSSRALPAQQWMRSYFERQLTRVYFALKPRAHVSMSISTVTTETSPLEITRVPCLSDNYAWLLHEHKTNLTAIVDPSEVTPVENALTQKGYKLNYVMNTHHHFDHTGGNLELKKKFNATVVGPAADRDRIPGIDVALKDGDEWDFGDLKMRVFDTPGHTRGHISLYFPTAASVFTGDTLFMLGCGRLFEGSPKQMYTSLSKLKALPPETKVYCGHEYTQANARWAVTEEPENADLINRKSKIDQMRQQGVPTVPASMAEELATNPFLRAGNVDDFAALRKSKDSF